MFEKKKAQKTERDGLFIRSHECGAAVRRIQTGSFHLSSVLIRTRGRRTRWRRQQQRDALDEFGGFDSPCAALIISPPASAGAPQTCVVAGEPERRSLLLWTCDRRGVYLGEPLCSFVLAESNRTIIWPLPEGLEPPPQRKLHAKTR